LAHIAKRPSPKRSGITHDPLGKFYWFNAHPVIDSLNLFNLRPNYFVAGAAAMLVIVGMALHLRRGNAKTARFVAIAALVPLSYLPNLVAQESWSSYRTQIGLSWLVLVLVGFSLRRLVTSSVIRITLLAGAAVVFGALAGYQVRAFFAYPQSEELAQLRKALATPGAAAATRFFMIQPPGGSVYAPYSRYDEFGRTSMYAFWVPQAAVNLVMEELYPGHAVVPVDLYPDPPAPGAMVIDMRQPPGEGGSPLPAPHDTVSSQPSEEKKAG
jgi:hypothetical protein